MIFQRPQKALLWSKGLATVKTQEEGSGLGGRVLDLGWNGRNIGLDNIKI